MKLRHLLITAILLSGGGMLTAAAQTTQESNYLYVRTADGYQVLDLNKVDRLTFGGGVMTASDQAGATVATFPQDQIEKMYVTEEAAAITHVGTDEAAQATFTYDAATCTATMTASAPFEVYSAAGAKLLPTVNATKGQTVCLHGLQPGAVILKSGRYTIKAVIK